MDAAGATPAIVAETGVLSALIISSQDPAVLAAEGAVTAWLLAEQPVMSIDRQGPA